MRQDDKNTNEMPDQETMEAFKVWLEAQAYSGREGFPMDPSIFTDEYIWEQWGAEHKLEFMTVYLLALQEYIMSKTIHPAFVLDN